MFEENCDVFVLIESGAHIFISIDFSKDGTAREYWGVYDDEPIRSYEVKPEDVIYGAKWTDNGLTYIAKMNSKRKFELI